jgi:molybdopterin synthase sulfur carrier subunit
MAVKVQIPAPLRSLTGGQAEVEVDATDLGGLIEGLDSRHRGLKERLCDADGNLRSYVRFFVNDEDVRFRRRHGRDRAGHRGGHAGIGSANTHRPVTRRSLLSAAREVLHRQPEGQSMPASASAVDGGAADPRRWWRRAANRAHPNAPAVAPTLCCLSHHAV